MPVCIAHYYEFAVAQTLIQRNLAMGYNLAAQQMDDAIPYIAPTPRMQIPEMPKPPIHMHNFNNSIVGSINYGTIQTVDVQITALKGAGNTAVAEALQKLTEAILAASTLPNADKELLLDQISYLSEQAAAAAKDRKKGTITAMLDGITKGVSAAGAVATVWQQVAPIIRGYFGF